MVEFGLIRTPEGIRAYGAGMLSSHSETVFSVDDASPHRIGFDLERVMRTNFQIDDFQETYFVLESFEDLFQATKRDFRPIYAAIQAETPLEPDMLLPGDKVISRGTGSWKARRQPNPLHA
jgi:phenylalanine-4-hydroxylase